MEQNVQGTVWHGTADKLGTGERHLSASLNFI